MAGKLQGILFLSARSDIGGGPRLMYELVHHMVNNRPQYRVYVCCPAEKPYFDQYRQLSTEGRIILWDLPLRRLRFGNFLRLAVRVRKEGISIVTSHGKGAGLWARMLKLTGSIKVVHSFHGIHVNNNLTITGWPYVCLERIFNKLTNVHACDSQAERNRAIFLKFTEENKSVVIHNGIDASEYCPVLDEEKSKIRQAIGLRNTFIIVTISRLAAVKNISFALDIIKEYSRRHGEICYVLVGGVDDISWERLQRDVESRGLTNIVKLMGQQKDIRQFYHAADIFLTTSLGEGLPTAVLEAQACGVPVLATDVVGNSEAVADGTSGFLLPLGDVDGFVEKLWILHENKQLRHDFGIAARANVCKLFTVQSMCEKFDKLLESIFP
jgi:glycosyltransferase involved in cell wall biosynthesis